MPLSRRRHPRFETSWETRWTLFSGGGHSAPGVLRNLSQSGALLCTLDEIDPRRWVRVLFHDTAKNVNFMAVGRANRCEPFLEPWGTDRFTLFRIGMEWVHPVHLSALHSQENADLCSYCGNWIADGPMSVDPDSNKKRCLACQLRTACRNLLIPTR